MITEDYVSFETAKLLKDKGFDEPCRSYWPDNNYLSFEHTKLFISNDNDFVYLLRPTIQIARKWLRKVHNIDISVTPDRKAGYSVLIFKDKRLPFDTLDSYSTYEQACEVAIKYCLENLI